MSETQRRAMFAKIHNNKTLWVYRVSYGKASTPVKDREYRAKRGTSVGNQKEWKDYAKKTGHAKVIFIDGDKRIEKVIR